MQSSLARTVPRANADYQHMKEMARAAWPRGWFCIHVDELRGMDRDYIETLGNQYYGKADR
jgi:hypothetical protein